MKRQPDIFDAIVVFFMVAIMFTMIALGIMILQEHKLNSSTSYSQTQEMKKK